MKNYTINTSAKYRLKDLAALYEVSIATLKKWLTPIRDKVGERRGNYYTPHQVGSIFEVYGVPPGLRGKKLKV